MDAFSSQTEADGIPKGWKPMAFRKNQKYTLYTVESEAGNYYVKAVSSGTGTGILKEAPIRIQDYPVLSWRWKVENILVKADVRKKKGDDYPARVYVGFRYDPESSDRVIEKLKFKAAQKRFGDYPPKAAIIYIWDNKELPGKTFDNAYTDHAKMVVLESGGKKLGRWVREERDVYEDYKDLFGEEPPEVGFVAVMTDTDNTHESAVAYYDDIIFSKP